MNRNETIKAIKNGLQARSSKTWSVTGGRGTAYGWLTISAPPKRLGCAQEHRLNFSTNECLECGGTANYTGQPWTPCPAHECGEKCYRGYITPEDRAELAELLGLASVSAQGVNVPASSAYYHEYIARAAGLTPLKLGTPYWD